MNQLLKEMVLILVIILVLYALGIGFYTIGAEINTLIK